MSIENPSSSNDFLALYIWQKEVERVYQQNKKTSEVEKMKGNKNVSNKKDV